MSFTEKLTKAIETMSVLLIVGMVIYGFMTKNVGYLIIGLIFITTFGIASFYYWLDKMGFVKK